VVDPKDGFEKAGAPKAVEAPNVDEPNEGMEVVPNGLEETEAGGLGANGFERVGAGTG